MTDTVKLKLTRPIEAHGEKFAELDSTRSRARTSWRRDCRSPSRSGPGLGSITKFDAVAIGKLISQSARIPPSSVGRLTPEDFSKAMGITLGFFGGAGPAMSVGPTSGSPASSTT